jgi:hypothetical protein
VISKIEARVESDINVKAPPTPSIYRKEAATVESSNPTVKNEGKMVIHTIFRESPVRKTFSLDSILEPYISAAQTFNLASFFPLWGFCWGIQNRV